MERDHEQPILPFSYFCDPWKSNEEQMVFVAEIDMDREENQHPKQCLEDTEMISTFIVPISTLETFLKGNQRGKC